MGKHFPTTALSHRDLGTINLHSRRYTRDGSLEALQVCAEYLVMCEGTEDEARVLYWWNEGTRDYAESEEHLRELKAALLRRAEEIKAEGFR